MFNFADRNKNKQLDRSEIVHAMGKLLENTGLAGVIGLPNEEELTQLFQEADADSSGGISMSEWNSFMRNYLTRTLVSHSRKKAPQPLPQEHQTSLELTVLINFPLTR